MVVVCFAIMERVVRRRGRKVIDPMTLTGAKVRKKVQDTKEVSQQKNHKKNRVRDISLTVQMNTVHLKGRKVASLPNGGTSATA